MDFVIDYINTYIDNFSMVEVVGIIASILVIVSFSMTRNRTIRIVNIIACIVFVAYGFVIQALAIWFLNGFLIFVHLRFLMKKQNAKPKPAKRFKKSNFKASSLRRDWKSTKFDW